MVLGWNTHVLLNTDLVRPIHPDFYLVSVALQVLLLHLVSRIESADHTQPIDLHGVVKYDINKNNVLNSAIQIEAVKCTLTAGLSLL